jgi:hypothetical protein
MSVRTLFPNLLNAARPALPKGSASKLNPVGRLRTLYTNPIAISIPRTAPRANRFGLYSLGLGLTFLSYQSLRKPVLCEVLPTGTTAPRPVVHDTGAPPSSMLDVYQLGFGTVCGICTGVFLKKGLRAIAFLLGGVFVLLQVRHYIYKKGRERADG